MWFVATAHISNTTHVASGTGRKVLVGIVAIVLRSFAGWQIEKQLPSFFLCALRCKAQYASARIAFEDGEDVYGLSAEG